MISLCYAAGVELERSSGLVPSLHVTTLLVTVEGAS